MVCIGHNRPVSGPHRPQPFATEHPALVLGLAETGLGVVRGLGRSGVITFGLDHRARLGARSRHVTAQRCPHPESDEAGFVDALLAVARACRSAPVLFITADVFLRAVARVWSQLVPHFRLLLPPPALVTTLIDKHHLYRCCLGHGIDVPRSVHVARDADPGALLETLAFPVFIKPSTAATRRAAFRGPAKGVVAADPDQARRIASEVMARGGDVMIQEIVEGPDSQCYKYCACVAADGRPLLEFSLQKLRNYPAHFGVGCCCVSRSVPEVLALGRQIFEAIGYRGVGSIEFKRDARDGRLKLIEINARYWQQVALPTACGMNFPVTHYLEATGQAPEPLLTFREGVTWMNLELDAASCLEYQREGTLSWTEWRESLRGPTVTSDTEWTDPWPTLGSGRPWRIAGRWAAVLAGFLR